MRLIESRFKWNMSKLPRDFSIAPATGYCSPGMSVNFIVSFRPTRHDSLIEGDASLKIEKYDSLRVKISGGCRELPDAIDTLFFTCRVREQLIKSLNVENNTAAFWKLKPEVVGDYFTVDEVLQVPAKGSAACIITYAPLVMNSESNPHKVMMIIDKCISNNNRILKAYDFHFSLSLPRRRQFRLISYSLADSSWEQQVGRTRRFRELFQGTLLLKLPGDDAPSVYSLQGLSLAPRELQRIKRQFPAKTKFTELLRVYNWTSRQQRYECKIERLNYVELAHENVETYIFTGNSRIDVPANNERDYRADFFSYKESTYNFKVTFTDQEGEYQFYELEYSITRPEEIQSIKLVTSARSSVYYTLKLSNPLSQRQVVYTAECQHPHVTIYDMPKTVAPSSNEIIGIEYHPVHPSEESVVKLDIHCEELGLFSYSLRLRATPAPMEETTRVAATLGSSATFSLTVNNLTKKDAVFAVKVDNECFITPASVEVPMLKSASFDVTYEPCDVENVFATLTATSEVAGEFVFPLIGTYTLPKPQGPYLITRNVPTVILFKNIFKDTRSFELILDNTEAFELILDNPEATVTSLRNLKSKQVVSIAVSLKNVTNGESGPENNTYPTGKLLIYCTDTKVSHVNWIYYLKGELNSR